ncbi:MAG: SH3 domain-containing protein [Syntrophobacterales bacterium]|nr:SH3 domain-containing protein [Syntrophobacterales bacterium]
MAAKIKRRLHLFASPVITSVLMIFLVALAQLAVPSSILAQRTIRDLSALSQNPLSYMQAATADQWLLPPEEQARLNREANLAFFNPWHRQQPHHSRETATWGVQKYENNPGYGSDGRLRSPNWIRSIIENVPVELYPQGLFPAITLRQTDSRMLPTIERHSNYSTPGIKNSFDNFQQSSIPAGTPVFITLISRDKKWLLAETEHLVGWVKAEVVAPVTPAFMTSWENGNYVIIVRDKTPVSGGGGALFFAPLGAVFPKVGGKGESVRIGIPQRDAAGRASLAEGSIPAGAAAEKPLPFTARNVARLAGELVGGKYGWGGFQGKRDCSATTRDLFAPFGILLPRNSIDQAGAGRFVSLLGLAPEKKEALITQQGVPWRTLLWTPGHIMLYIGTYRGKPLIFHNFWKVGTKGANGVKGRIIVGKTVITTLHPGSELPDRDLPDADILFGLQGMILLGEKNQQLLPAPPLK